MPAQVPHPPRKPARAIPERVAESNTQGNSMPNHPSPNPSASVFKSKLSKVCFFVLFVCFFPFNCTLTFKQVLKGLQT